VIPDSRRELQRAKVDTLAKSMQRLGLQSPIGVRMVDGTPRLVYGLHRLWAAREVLEWDRIDCRIIEGDDRHARLVEISENVHRAELTALEEAEQVAEWIRLVEELQQEISGQSAQKFGPGRPEGGLSAAAREIGVNRDAARRAQAIDRLSAEAKATARDLGLADNQAALLKAAKSPDPVLSLHQRIKQRRHTPEELALRRTKRAEQQKDP
jgi:ParB family chromosome partitioning protein